MSSKTKSTATKEEAKPALVPKLRFPAFRGADGWSDEALSDVATIVMGSSPKSECYNQSEIGLPLLQGNADIKNRLSAPRIFTSEITKECKVGDILLSVRAPVGSVAKSVHHACIGRGIAAIHSKRPNSQEFLYQWLLSYEPRWVNISQGGTFDAINSDDLKQVGLAVPSPAEQQKIAECLSSVDELMAAQARKVDALKTHKKGLMQQLFPREGETQPRLRFPEFQNAGDWAVKRLKQLATYTKGFAFKSHDYKGEGVRIIRVSDLGPDFIKEDNDKIYLDADAASDHARYKLSQGEIIITTVGSKPELVDSAVGRGILVSKPDEGLLNQNLLKLEMLPGTDSRFLFCNINTALYQKFIVSISRGNANQANIAVKELMDFELKVPSPAEQQCIATCLSSLDALITAETQKHDALKTHKKGLMQQLFPSPEEVEA